MSSSPSDLIRRLLAGETRALARAISIVEDRLPASREIVREIYPRAGRAPILGVTGPPGGGKSTLVDGLAALYRREDRRVGIIAVDPSSAFSGGAVLGDRIRMQRHSTDEGVFIRSMATRGHFGGLATSTVDVTDLLDAAGCERVIVETVGVGQDEVDVVRVADVVLVVLVPGLGDDIQTIKAGIMEIPDIFVLNKADREGIDRLHADVKAMLGLIDDPARTPPPIVRTVASDGRGLEELHATVEGLLSTVGTDRLSSRRRERSRERLMDLLRERVLEWAAGPASDGAFDRMVDQVAQRSIDPYSAADELLGNLSPRATTQTRSSLDHIGIAVRSIEAAVALYRDALGLPSRATEAVPSEGVRIAFVPVGDSRIELLEPIDGESPVARFLARHGEGIHHVCLRVPDLEASLSTLERHGAEIIPPAPRVGAGGRRVAFVHPRSASGVLLELVEG